jgi:hypothetical protein
MEMVEHDGIKYLARKGKIVLFPTRCDAEQYIFNYGASNLFVTPLNTNFAIMVL